MLAVEEEECVKIFNYFNNEYVQARIVPMSSTHIREIELTWKPQLKTENCWDKDLDISRYLNEPKKYEVYLLECDSMAQGIIALNIAKYPSRLEVGKNLVYLNLLSVAPWNRVSRQGIRNYTGVGTSLLTFAILRSINLGFQGRIALHSIKEAESFFQRLPFFDGGYDLLGWGNKGDYLRLKYLEMPENEVDFIMLSSYLTWYLN